MAAMPDRTQREPDLGVSVLQWLKQGVARDGLFHTLQQFMAIMWEFARESLPSRRRQRYGDVEFDWDYRVDTTSATVGWRARLLGLFHSPYQATDPALFREMLANLNIDFREFIFIDIGSGKGRVLLMAAEYPFRRIVGVELLPELDRIAQENIGRFKSASQQCFAIESIGGDARDFAFPVEPSVLYLFNPLPEAGLVQLLGNLEESLRQNPRTVFILYHNPLLEHVVTACSELEKVPSTHQYSIYKSTLQSLEEIVFLTNSTLVESHAVKHPLWQWILAVLVLVALFPAVRDGFDRSIPLSRTSRFVRVIGGSLWAGILLLGMLLELYEASR